MDKWNNDEEWDIQELIWKKAIRFADEYHNKAGQFRIGKNGEKLPYITHICEIMRILMNEAKISSDDVLAVAALHDVIEDTECSFEDIEMEFGTKIAKAVDLLTRKDGQPFEEYAKGIFTNEEYPWVGDVKLADRIHNLRTYPETNNKPKIKYKYEETVKYIKPYAEKQSPILNKKLVESLEMIQNFLEDEEIQH